ncbi:MAG TPA: tetratricopeptide repeat protein [Bryobacteraceae bacterium]|jgi:tetratricopeptide (TPR) repeat protein|nr:tetratricopeptide repeat protein [Bryobacteraceae bacterium]
MFAQRGVFCTLLLVLTSACARAPQSAPHYAILPFDNLTGDASLDWIARTAPRIAAAEISDVARSAATIDEAYLEKANRFVHGYYTKDANALRLTVEVEDSATHKMLSTEQIDGSVLASANALAKSLEPKAKPFSTSNEEAIAAWGRGEYEKAVTLDPSFGLAWRAWIDTLARSGDTAGAIQVAERALQHPVNSEIDGLRIELVRATLQKDAHAEHEVLLKLTARVADPQLLATLGEIEVRAREFAVAEGDYKKILAIQPDNPDALNKLGYALGYQGKVPEAASILAQYGKSPGQEPNALDSLGEMYFMNGKFPEAEKAFLRGHDLNAAFLAGADLRKAAFARWLGGDLAGADALFGRYLDFRAKLQDQAVEWQHAQWEFTTGRRDQALARIQKISIPQAAVETRIWRGEARFPADLAALKHAYESSQPAADGLFRTLYAEALLANGEKDEAKKLAARWPLPDNAGDPVLQSLVFPKYLALRRILGL